MAGLETRKSRPAATPRRLSTISYLAGADHSDITNALRAQYCARRLGLVFPRAALIASLAFEGPFA